MLYSNRFEVPEAGDKKSYGAWRSLKVKSSTPLFLSLVFCLGAFVAVQAESPDLPDGVKVTIVKTGASPASITLDQPGKPRIRLNEGEWDKLPESVRPYFDKLFGLKKRPSIDVSLDCSEAPEATAWGENAVTIVKEWFPKLVEALDSEGYRPPESVTLVFRKMDGVAHATRGRIVISVDWITKHPGDIGMVVHELVHIVQAYRKPVPGWVTEGVADYLRFFIYEKNGDRTCRVDPNRAKYTDSYRTTAAFFDWIVRTKDENFIKKLNAACREGKYNDDFFKETTGTTLDELWSGFIESLKNK